MVDYRFNDALMESIMDFTNAQPALYRIKYRCALEDTNPAGKARLVAKLYEECIRPSGVDYGSIPDSKGNILKLKNYDRITVKAIGILNELFADDPKNKTIHLLNDFHNMLISCRADFEYGYKYDIQIIQVMYCNMVRALYELIDFCIATYAESIRNNTSAKKGTLNDTLLIKSVIGYVTAYKKGEWQRVMKTLKDPKIASVGENYIQMDLASCAYAMEDFGAGVLGTAVILGGLLVLLTVTRWLIAFFFRSSAKLSTYLENEADLLKNAVDAQKKNNSSSNEAIEKQQKWINFMEDIAGFINAKILKADTAAKKDIQLNNAKDYDKDLITPDTTDGEFTFL